MENQIHRGPEDHQPLSSSTDLVLDLSLPMTIEDEVLRHESPTNSNSDTQYHGDAYMMQVMIEGNRIISSSILLEFSPAATARGSSTVRRPLGGTRMRTRGRGRWPSGTESSAMEGLVDARSWLLFPYMVTEPSTAIRCVFRFTPPTSSYMSSSISHEYGSGYGHHGNLSKSGMHGHDGWHRLPLHHQPNVGKLGGQGIAGSMVNGNSVPRAASEIGIARFKGIRKFSPDVDGIGGGLWQGVVVGSQLESKQEELQNIDLSLKL